ncbi:putative Nuclear protein localization protein 4 [Paratrimastix pyriformis]|uniref:Nuclear protein localization protein 4 n=1 Tax=Paratrimastix pyriformis TaxID=342808 RepID=A0ABQ8UJ45_9EUKA|nr:putative Nuclear protein localization protein 4 [Paratrimastix pyriformis]
MDSSGLPSLTRPAPSGSAGIARYPATAPAPAPAPASTSTTRAGPAAGAIGTQIPTSSLYAPVGAPHRPAAPAKPASSVSVTSAVPAPFTGAHGYYHSQVAPKPATPAAPKLSVVAAPPRPSAVVAPARAPVATPTSAPPAQQRPTVAPVTTRPAVQPATVTRAAPAPTAAPATRPPAAAQPPRQPAEWTIRVMTPERPLRVQISPSQSIGELKQRVAAQLGKPASAFDLVLHQAGPAAAPFRITSTVASAGLQHGSMVLARFGAVGQPPVDQALPESFAEAAKTSEEGQDGEMVLVDEPSDDSSAAEEPNMLKRCNHGPEMHCPNCTKSSKMVPKRRRCRLHPPWGSCIQCIEWRRDLMPKLHQQAKRKCKGIRMETMSAPVPADYARVPAGAAFQQGVQQYHMQRLGYMYGTENPDKTVTVEFIYEPPQDGSAEGVVLLPDPDQTNVDTLASMLGMKQIGWVFSHSQRAYPLSAAELLQAARFQDKHGKRFVTLTAPVMENGDIEIHAFQTSQQCVRLLRRGTLSDEPADETHLATTEPVIVELAETGRVEVEFFMSVIPLLAQATPARLNNRFPIENRPRQATLQTLKDHLLQQTGTPFIETLSDFHLLLFLSKQPQLDMLVIAQLCEAVKQHSVEGFEGNEILITSLAGL